MNPTLPFRPRSPSMSSIPTFPKDENFISSTSDNNEPRFTYFTRLPTEAQLMIYQNMFPGPRRVHLTFTSSDKTTCLRSKAPIPVLLHLNRDARYEALKQYRLCFGTEMYAPNIWLNPNIDTLFFGPDDEIVEKGQEFDIETPRWPCHVESSSRTLSTCRPGCGHDELTFFFNHIASHSSSQSLQTIGIDLRMNQADVLHFFNKLNGDQFGNLKKVVVYYPSKEEALRRGDEHGGNEYLFGWKMWQVCGLVKSFEMGERLVLEVEEFVVEDSRGETTKVARREGGDLEMEEDEDEPTKFFQNWLKGLVGPRGRGRRMVMLSE